MAADDNAQIARRTASGSVYSVAASAVTLTLGFIRTTLMLRLLFPEQFGVTTLALFYMNLVAELFGFGFDSALVHHKQADDRVRGVYFTLKIGSTLLTALFALLAVPILAIFYPNEPLLGPVLAAYALVSVFKGVNASQETMLTKAMAFRELSITDIASSIVMTVVAPTLAWLGFGVWAIVAERAVGVLTRLLLIGIFFRRWRPRFAWDRTILDWFWRYGRQVWVVTDIDFALDRFDDWFVGTFLGSSALGYYSRAYEYARYPRRVIANPILLVFFPTFAHLQDDRQRLSRAFFRATSLMVRLGGLFSLIFILTAPEFIPLLLGEKWLPMLTTFQLMIIYTFLDPLALGARNLLLAVGDPNRVLRIRLLQAAVFVPAVFLLGLSLGIEGVAIAADLMVLIGAAFLFYYSHRVVDYSTRALWFWPIAAMLVTGPLVYAAEPLWNAWNPSLQMAVKSLCVVFLYGGILWIAERDQLKVGGNMIWGLLKPMFAARLPARTERR